jgi:hypothetical protein
MPGAQFYRFPPIVLSQHVESPAIPVFLLRLLSAPFFISNHNMALNAKRTDLLKRMKKWK